MKRIYTDGASRGNPGRAAIAFIIGGEEASEYNAVLEGEKTNNEAEYIAVREALEFAAGRHGEKWKKIEIVSDSRLLVEQMSGRWAINEPRLQALAGRISGVIARSGLSVTYKWVPRTHEMMKRADALCNEALDKGASVIYDDQWVYEKGMAPGDTVEVVLRGELVDIRNHGTTEKPLWVACVKTKNHTTLVEVKRVRPVS